MVLTVGLAEIAALTVPREGEHVCGDRCAWWIDDEFALLAVVDGLGHGPLAADASAVAERVVGESRNLGFPELFARADRALGGLRGAALGLARVAAGSVRYAAIGNTRFGRWRDGAIVHLPAQAGIVGAGLRRPIEVQQVDFAPGDWLLLYTDGIAEDMRLPVAFPEWDDDPGLLCRHVVDRWRDANDDAGILVARM